MEIILFSLMDTADRARSEGIKFFGGLNISSNPAVVQVLKTVILALILCLVDTL